MKKPANFKLLLTAIVVTIIVVATSILVYQHFHSSTLIIQVAPTNAVITIDNKTYQNGLFTTAPKDQVDATISADGFKTKNLSLSLEKGKVNKLLTYLTPENDDWSYYEAAENQESLSILLTNSGYQSWDLIKVNSNLTTDQDTSADALIKKLSIKSVTPIQFSICGEPATRSNCDAISVSYDYSSECDNMLCLVITGRKAAISQDTLNLIKNKISEQGYNFTDYPYFYKQNEN